MIDKQEAVRMRSYFLWENDGRPEGQASDYWFRAEAELAHERSSAKPAKVAKLAKPKSKRKAKAAT